MPAEALLVAGLALALDMAAGDPPTRLHPTAWLGRLAARAVPLCRSPSPRAERAAGAALAAAAVGGAAAAGAAVAYAASLAPGWWAAALYVAAGAVVLKTAVAARGLGRHAEAVADALEAGDLQRARGALAAITKRGTGSLGPAQVASGAIESVSENTVDGVTGPLLYFALLGLPGALAYRAASTLDSMVGYRTPMFRDIGRAAAGLDSALNWAPARITGAVMVAASALLGRDWRGSYRAMARDGRLPDSRNSGYPMAAMAGALGAELEKPGCYRLAAGGGAPGPADVRASVSLMRAASALFCAAVAMPLAAALCLAGWWPHA